MSNIKRPETGKNTGWGNLSGSYNLKKAIKNFIFKVCRAVLLFGLCFLILQPLLNKLSISFMNLQDLYDTTVISIPRNFNFDNYILSNKLMDYWPSLLQTSLIIIISSVLQVAACTLAGYGFARYRFPFKNIFFLGVILIIVVPPQTIITSLYLNFHFFDIFGLFRLIGGKPVNLMNNVASIWLLSATGMGLKSGLYIFILRQYFRGVPKELEEAAYVDGCGRFMTFARIMLPDAAPVLTSCFLFSFVWQWTDSFYTTLFLSRQSMLSIKLAGLIDNLDEWYSIMSGFGRSVFQATPIAYAQAINATGMLMFIAPLILLYLVAQKAFIESLSQTGIKM